MPASEHSAVKLLHVLGELKFTLLSFTVAQFAQIAETRSRPGSVVPRFEEFGSVFFFPGHMTLKASTVSFVSFAVDY